MPKEGKAVGGARIRTSGGSCDFSVPTIKDSVGVFKLFPELRDVDRGGFLFPR